MSNKKNIKYFYYTGQDTDLYCKYKNCREKGALILQKYVCDYVCEACGKYQKIELSDWYQPILKINSKHIKADKVVK